MICQNKNFFQNKRLIGCKREQLIQINNIDDTIYLMEFKEFNKSSSKKRVRIKDIFILMCIEYSVIYWHNFFSDI